MTMQSTSELIGNKYLDMNTCDDAQKAALIISPGSIPLVHAKDVDIFLMS